MMKKINFLLLFAMAVFLSACRDELDYLNNENTGPDSYHLSKDNIKTQILHRPDYEKRSFLKPSVSRIENYLNAGSGGNSSLSKATAVQDHYEIYTDTFEEVAYLDAKYHSFYIIGDPSSGIEEKLILKSINNQVTEKYILKYRRLADFSIDANSYQTLKITESTSGNGASLQVFTDTFSMGCSVYTLTYMDCEIDGYHHTDGEYCDYYNVYMPNNTMVVSFDAACTAGSGSQTSGGDGGTSGSTGGTPSNNTVPGGETPPVITLPTKAPLYIIQRPRNTVCNPLDLSAEEIDQINGNYNIRLKIYQYLALKGYNASVCNDLGIDQEMQDFVKFILQYFKDHPTHVWQDFYDAYLAKPCEKTKALLNNPEVQTKLDSLKNKSLSKGEIGFKTKKDGTVTGCISGGKHEVDLGVKTGYQGGYHNHTPRGIAMHSPPDIDNNLLAFARAQPAGEHKNAYFGMIVKKVCTGCPSGYKIYHYIIRFDGTYDDSLTSFSDADLKLKGIDYTKLYTDLTNPFGSYGNTYIDTMTGDLTNEGLEILFFDTVNKMGLSNKIILQRIEDDGTVNNITLNADGLHTTTNPCT